jgi:hypothetical protein
MKSEETKRIEQKEHKALTYFLVAKGFIEDDEEGFVITTEAGKEEVKRITKPLSMEEIALLLIFFCETEGIKYHIKDGVVRPEQQTTNYKVVKTV